jgi:uncharacterized Zn finger protein
VSKKKYPVRIPRFAAGIRAQGLNSFGERSWWSRRWSSIVESMGLAGRLGRGKSYAVSGQVRELRLAGPHVEAKVVGTRKDAYRVTIDFRVPDDDAAGRIVSRIKDEPMLAARILVGDLPTEIELFFADEGCHLFPGGKIAPGRYDMTTACSCPDYANPCKHTAAVLILLGEEIARRPATLLELRGISLESLYE